MNVCTGQHPLLKVVQYSLPTWQRGSCKMERCNTLFAISNGCFPLPPYSLNAAQMSQDHKEAINKFSNSVNIQCRLHLQTTNFLSLGNLSNKLSGTDADLSPYQHDRAAYHHRITIAMKGCAKEEIRTHTHEIVVWRGRTRQIAYLQLSRTCSESYSSLRSGNTKELQQH